MLKKLLIFCGILIGGGLVGWFFGSLSNELLLFSAYEPPGVLGFIVQLLVACLIVILVHELGHVIGGWRAGYSFIMLTVGPFKWVREQGRLRWRWNTSLNTFGGLALMKPPVAQSESRAVARYILGGPTASFCLFVVSVFSSVLIQMNQPQASFMGHLAHFLVVLALVSLVITIGALVPYGDGGFASDGSQYLDLMKGGRRAERRLMMLTLTAHSLNGKRPREWDTSLIERLIELAAHKLDQICVAAHHIAFYHYLDLGQIDRARTELDMALELREGYPNALQSGLWLEQAFFRARYEGDGNGAKESLEKGSGGYVEAHTRARAEAAVALANGDLPQAMTAIAHGLSQIDRSMDRGGAIAEKEWLLELQAQARRLSDSDRDIAVG